MKFRLLEASNNYYSPLPNYPEGHFANKETNRHPLVRGRIGSFAGFLAFQIFLKKNCSVHVIGTFTQIFLIEISFVFPPPPPYANILLQNEWSGLWTFFVIINYLTLPPQVVVPHGGPHGCMPTTYNPMLAFLALMGG